jgi:RNA-directed DNA polymerase
VREAAKKRKLAKNEKVRFVEHRIGDKRIVHLIQKWLKAGVMRKAGGSRCRIRTPQGAVIPPIRSAAGILPATERYPRPIPANLYLQYVLDLRVDPWRKKKATGDGDHHAVRRRRL